MVNQCSIPKTTQLRWIKKGYCPWPRRKMNGQTNEAIEAKDNIYGKGYW